MYKILMESVPEIPSDMPWFAADLTGDYAGVVVAPASSAVASSVGATTALAAPAARCRVAGRLGHPASFEQVHPLLETEKCENTSLTVVGSVRPAMAETTGLKSMSSMYEIMSSSSRGLPADVISLPSVLSLPTYWPGLCGFVPAFASRRSIAFQAHAAVVGESPLQAHRARACRATR